MYYSFKQLDIELYTDEKSPDAEQRVEEVLLRHNIYYTKSETWIESEKLYEVIYEMEVGPMPQKDNSRLDIESLEVFENIAYIMAKHADPDNVPSDPDEWLERFNTFSIYEILPQLIDLWGMNVETQIESKKTSPD